MAGHTISRLRIVDLRHQPAPSEHQARRLHIDFGPFAQDDGRDVVIIGAIVAFMVGLALWGFLTLSVIAGIDSLLGETESRQTAYEASETRVFNCADVSAVRALSAENEARLQAQCGAVLPVRGPVDVPVSIAGDAPAVPSATADNRADCDEIRGTDYSSEGERAWYLANCVTQ